MKTCTRCNKDYPDDYIFCPHCGNSFERKRLFRSRHDRKLLGICGGLGEYFDVDSNIIRVLTALAILYSGVIPGLIVYLLLAIIIPEG